jgi:hypothetical protein
LVSPNFFLWALSVISLFLKEVRRGSWWVNFPLLRKRVGRTRRRISYHRTFAISYLNVNFDRLLKFFNLLLNLLGEKIITDSWILSVISGDVIFSF